MVIWYEHLYYKNCGGRQAKEWRKKITKRLEQKKPMFPIYCVCLASNPSNLLDIMNVNELLLPYYQKRNVVIIGLAGNRSEAMELASRIVLEVYEKTGDFNIRSFVENH